MKYRMCENQKIPKVCLEVWWTSKNQALIHPPNMAFGSKKCDTAVTETHPSGHWMRFVNHGGTVQFQFDTCGQHPCNESAGGMTMPRGSIPCWYAACHGTTWKNGMAGVYHPTLWNNGRNLSESHYMEFILAILIPKKRWCCDHGPIRCRIPGSNFGPRHCSNYVYQIVLLSCSVTVDYIILHMRSLTIGDMYWYVTFIFWSVFQPLKPVDNWVYHPKFTNEV